MRNATSGVSEKVQSCQRSWPTARCPDEESAIMAVLDFAYGRYNMLHPSKTETMRLGVCSVSQDTCPCASGSNFVFLFACVCVWMLVGSLVRWFVGSFVCLFVCLVGWLVVCLFVCLVVCLFVCLFVCCVCVCIYSGAKELAN